MANTTLGNLKIGALRRAANSYNSGDASALVQAGGIINDVLTEIQAETRDSLYWKDLNNSVNTTANQAYVDLVDTDILEILSVFQATTKKKLTRINRRDYVSIYPDTSVSAGIPDIAYDEEQIISVAGVNTFRLFLMPTPASAIAILYDYLKNARFSADGTSADGEYCALPSTYDNLIYAMFKAKWFGIIDSENSGRIAAAQAQADNAKRIYYAMLRTKSDEHFQAGSRRDNRNRPYWNVKATPTP